MHGSAEEKCEAFRQSVFEAWSAYERTGLHITSAETDAWLEQLEKGNDVEPPEAHV